MTIRGWRRIAVVLVCTVMGGLVVAWGVPTLGAMVLIAISGLSGIAVFAILAPDVDDEPTTSAPKSSGALPRGVGRHLLERIPSPLFLIDARGRIVYANTATRTMLPRLEQGVHYASLFRAPAFVDGVAQVMQGTAEQTVTFTTFFAGIETHLLAQMRQMEADQEFGAGQQVLVQLSDETRRMATERMRTDFIANASHELRTPLASIIGYIETLQGHARDDEAARIHFLDIMSQQAARMQRLVEDLMSLSRIEMDARSTPTTPCDLSRIVLEVTDGMQPLAQRRKATLQVTFGQETAGIVADRDQIGQVLSNLIENALKYGGEGGTVRVFRTEADSRFPGMIGVGVSDDGPGIGREHLPRLTERFYRVNAKQSRAQGGTGLGLAIVKHILARHGGELDVASVQGLGSTFTAWLPLHTQDEAA
ncbi:ATP-binding protein [Pontivivens nitratireducens]|uniref:histidine kinase n=1 Tax=Pontivivens nitratireducens TaxID=2758038 RepID=A0A6G7VIU1_9RHOB|nr:ATP-binding protein [Pontibrevibacter nitratireducens]QIK40013.1 PAS domain-containing protein [Pontibrevibacter nitratireducens]